MSGVEGEAWLVGGERWSGTEVGPVLEINICLSAAGGCV